MVDAKRCRICGEVKPLSDFYAMKGMRDGHRNECKSCNLKDKHERYRRDPEPTKARVKKWQRENRERHNARVREYRQRPEVKRAQRAGHLRRKYGITLDEYDALLEKQGGVCAICGRALRDDISLHVDHDHDTGDVRGLLCFRCNNAVGDLEEDPVILRRAAGYCDPVDAELERRIRERVTALKSA